VTGMAAVKPWRASSDHPGDAGLALSRARSLQQHVIVGGSRYRFPAHPRAMISFMSAIE
jgi:hypothetical protein